MDGMPRYLKINDDDVRLPVEMQLIPTSFGPAARVVSARHQAGQPFTTRNHAMNTATNTYSSADPRAIYAYTGSRELGPILKSPGPSSEDYLTTTTGEELHTSTTGEEYTSDGSNEAMDNSSSQAASEYSQDEIPDQDLEEDNETLEQWKERFTDYVRKMMFVSGETAEPSPETTTLIEEIVRQQVVEMLTRSTALAARRGVRSISTDDLIFLIRHDKAKVSRLKTFLSWKDVRKNVKDFDDKGGADAADFGAGDDPLAGAGVAGPSDVAAKPKNKRAKVGLPWDVNSFYSIQVPEREDEEDEDEEEQNYATLQRLANADERTKHMTREEYVFWSDCRQASFTFRKGKRFREWAGFGIVTDSRPNDDIVDILGFLTFEIVQTLTEGALKVKEQADRGKKGRETTAGENGKKRKREPGLFDPPAEGRTPIEPRHIHEAYRKLQATPNKAVAMLLHGGRAPLRTPLRLI